MFVRRLSLTNLRCRHELEVDLDEGLNILVGPNGAGKTTVLEAAALVLLGAPLRTTNVREVIARDRDHLRVEIELGETGGGSGAAAAVTAAAAYGRDGERRLTADGAALDDAGRWKELLPVRTFAPDDLRLIKGSPRRRREYLDSLAGRSYPEYPGTLRRYEEALSQRNYLLRTVAGRIAGYRVRAVGDTACDNGAARFGLASRFALLLRRRLPADPRGVDGRAERRT